MDTGPTIQLHNIDCMEYMATLPDKAFDLAIVDPPYGIGGGKYGDGSSAKRRYRYVEGTLERLNKQDYDTGRPSHTYFRELMRATRRGVIWGGNHFADLLPPSACWIVWDKKIASGLSLSDCELAYGYGLGGRISMHRQMWAGVWKEGEMGVKRIHPTQKPVALYKWLLKNYAKPGDRILDTHLGSGSIAIACHDMGFDLVGCEIDEDYIQAARKRLANHQSQMRLL